MISSPSSTNQPQKSVSYRLIVRSSCSTIQCIANLNLSSIASSSDYLALQLHVTHERPSKGKLNRPRQAKHERGPQRATRNGLQRATRNGLQGQHETASKGQHEMASKGQQGLGSHGTVLTVAVYPQTHGL